MTLPVENSWPKPYLLELYSQAVQQGCIRILLHGDHERFKSLKAAFYRIRRRQDVQSTALMRQEYYLCSITWEAERGTALIIYNQLPDGQKLPEIESVEDKHLIPMPTNAAPPPLMPGMTPAVEPDFDATQFVGNLMDEISITDSEEGGNGDSDLG